MAPGTVLGGTLGLDARWRWLSLGLEGLANAPSSAVASAGGVSTWAGVGAVVPCVSFGPVFMCAVGQAGLLESSGRGTPGAHTGSSIWWAAGGRIGAEIHVHGSWLVRARVDLLADLSPTTLDLNGHPAWTAPDVAGTAALDGVWRFW